MIKCIHTGDLHLGSQFKTASFDSNFGKQRRLELMYTFERIIDRAKKENIDFLFIAGDMYEGEYFTVGDIKRVRDILSELENTNIVIATGNHDPLNKGNLYNSVEWSENIHIFHSNGISSIEFDEHNTVIWGYSWDRKEERIDPLANFQLKHNNKINILLIHGDLTNKNSPYLPIDKNRLETIGFDYVALGHIHKPQFVTNNIAYCGSPEPLDFGELGEHGIVEGTIEKGEVNMSFLPFAKRTFNVGEITISETMSYMDIMDELRTYDSLEKREKNFYRIVLRGIRDRDVDLNLEEIYEQLKHYYYYLEIVDETIPDYNLEKLRLENSNNIIGLFIEEMSKMDLDDEINKNALYIGLEVLLKEKVVG